MGKWVAIIDLEPRAFEDPGLRRTKVALVYKKTCNLRACQLLLGHRKLESTARSRDIEVDDALALPEQIDLQAWSWRLAVDPYCIDERRFAHL